jgi:C1A family cysteine protease
MSLETQRAMGWLPDIPSAKDYTETTPVIANMLASTGLKTRIQAITSSGGSTASAGTAAAPALVATVDLRQYFSPIENQGQLGSCTANAAVGLVEYFEKKATGRHIDASRLFVYKATRNLLGWTGDTGAYLRSTMGALALFGAPPERYWPYDPHPAATNTKFDVEPTPFCYAFAENYKSIKYLRLDPANTTTTQLLANIKTYLAAGFPSMFGFPVYDEFMNVGTDGLVKYPSTSSHLYGGHAIVAIGYDDNKQIGSDRGALLIRNSWGTNWGIQGNGWLSYKYVTEELAVDWWTVLSQNWVNTGNF